MELGDIDVDEAAMDIGAHNDNAAANLGSISLLQMSRSALENDRQAPERSGQSIVEHREMGEIQQNREHRKGASPVALPQVQLATCFMFHTSVYSRTLWGRLKMTSNWHSRWKELVEKGTNTGINGTQCEQLVVY